ncbi:DMT family transporter [Hamadaea tsunoensis]|uniref:DMT family transporter n=1 Tax=Hamadaea tsunoensis TaxID=53368 RepID=UPI000687FD8E|nr:EamA family transporter [Hamadaea tsunoensis]
MSRKGWVLFVALGVIWGVPYLFIKVAVGGVTPASLVFFRCAVAVLLLMPIAVYNGGLRGLHRHWKPLLAFTCAEIALPWFLLSRAEQQLSSSLTGLLIAGVPLVGALLGWATARTSGGSGKPSPAGEKLGPRRISGLAVGLAGVAALVGLDLSGGDTWAVVQVGIVAIGYALGPFILSRHLAEQNGTAVMAVALALTAVLYAPVGIAQLPDHWPAGKVVVSLIVLGVLCTAIALVTFNALIDEVGPVRATVITYVNPAVAVALGVLLLHEKFTAGIAVGFVLVLAGSVLATHRSPGNSAPEQVASAE